MKPNNDLSEHRFEQALSCLKQAKLLIAVDEYKGAANRSYYLEMIVIMMTFILWSRKMWLAS